jgi:hypothetical protein
MGVKNRNGFSDCPMRNNRGIEAPERQKIELSQPFGFLNGR